MFASLLLPLALLAYAQLNVQLVWGQSTRAANAPGKKLRCYSCASDNMRENFLTRSRGPPGRVQEPLLYDSMCDLDTWMLKEKSAVDCDGPCFKWQQILNNSGVYSYSTIRGCYARMFGSAQLLGAVTQRLEDPFHSNCTTKEKVLECIDQSTLIEHTCYCRGDFCNGGVMAAVTLVTVLASLLITSMVVHVTQPYCGRFFLT